MSGMDMMLKSFGIDPEKIKADIGSMGALATDLRERQVRTETAVNEILQIVKEMRDERRGEQASGDGKERTVIDGTGSGS